MKPADGREEALFREALQRPKGAERQAFLDGACLGNQPLRARLEALLQGHEGPDPFLETPTVPAGSATVLLPLEEGPGTVIGRYRLLEKIGEGGFGAVYAAEQREPVKRRVALKIIKLGMDTRQVVARFESERQALALMDHPNIAKVLDAGATDSGRPYFVMELVRGIPITQHCDQNNLPTEKRLKLFIQVCQAIQHAHQKGIIHRDIKPSNILVTVQDADRSAVAKVIDFGIAKATQQQLTDKTVYTQLQQFIGTPAYMSPEQAEMSAQDIDTRSDIYSLGVLLYELLTGSTPFDAKELLRSGLDEMRKIIREREPVRPSTRLRQTSALRAPPSALSTLNAQLSTDLDWIVMRCLEKDRTRRYETANGLAMDIERFLNHEPVVARPPSRTYQLQKLIQRNKVVFACLAVVAVTLVAGLWVSITMLLREKEAFRLASSAQAAERSQKNEAIAMRTRAEQEREQARALRYCSDMGLAWRALRENNLAEVTSLLEAQIPHTGERDFRAWEWRYLWQACRGEQLFTLGPMSGEVMGLALLPDGRLATGEMPNGRVTIWDLEHKQPVRCNPGLGNVSDLAASPDGRVLAVATWGDSVVMLETQSLEIVGKLRHAHPIIKLAFSRDGKFLSAAGGEDVSLWEVATRRRLWTRTSHAAWLNHAPFSRDEQSLMCRLDGGYLAFLSVKDGTEIRRLEGQVGHDVADLALSRDGRLAVATRASGILLLDLATGHTQVLTNHHGWVRGVAFSPDGRQLASAGDDGLVKLWQVESGLETTSFHGHQKPIWSLAYAADGQRLFTGAQDQTVRAWPTQPESPGQSYLVADGFSNTTVSRDGRFLVAGDTNGVWRIVNLETGAESARFKRLGPFSSLALRLDGEEIAFGMADGSVEVWNAPQAKVSWQFQAHSNIVDVLAFSPDGNCLATAGRGAEIRVWGRGESQPRLARRLGFPGMRAEDLAFFPDSGTLVVSVARAIHLLRLHEGSEDRMIESGGGAYSIDISSDGRLLAAGEDDSVEVWEVSTLGHIARIAGSQGNFSSVAFSPDGRRLMGAGGGTAWLWDLRSRREVGRFEGDATLARFQSSGDTVVIAGGRRYDVLRAPAMGGIEATRETEAKAQELLQQQVAAAAEHERVLRTQDPGAIKQWLVLAPIPLEDRTDEAALKALDQQQIAPEKELLVRAGDRVKVGASELVWKAVRLEDYAIDFNKLLGAVTESSVAYAVCYIQSDSDQTGLLMKVGSDDQAKVYLNGNEIFRNEKGRPYVPDEDLAEGVELKRGINVLVFKVVNTTEGWQGSVRFSDAAGQPVKGIRVTLTPP